MSELCRPSNTKILVYVAEGPRHMHAYAFVFIWCIYSVPPILTKKCMASFRYGNGLLTGKLQIFLNYH